MAKKKAAEKKTAPAAGKPSSLIDTRVIYCGDNLDQLKKFPDILDKQITYKLA